MWGRSECFYQQRIEMNSSADCFSPKAVCIDQLASVARGHVVREEIPFVAAIIN
jgi:hypothetical protein